MSRDNRKSYYRERDQRDRDRGRAEYRNFDKHRPISGKRSPNRSERDKRRSRSPIKSDKDIDENILREISKLPEPSELWDSQFQDNSFPAPPPPSFVQEVNILCLFNTFTNN